MKIIDACRQSVGLFKNSSPVVLALFWIAAVAMPIMALELLFSSKTQQLFELVRADYVKNQLFQHNAWQFIIWGIFLWPIIEELTYRGPIWIIQLAFLKIERLRRHTAIKWCLLGIGIALQAYLWGSKHETYAFIAIGAILGILVIKTQRLWPAIAVHIFLNAIAFLGVCIFHA